MRDSSLGLDNRDSKCKNLNFVCINNDEYFVHYFCVSTLLFVSVKSA